MREKIGKIERLKKQIEELKERIENDRLAMLNIIEDLRESQEKYRMLIDVSPDGIISVDENGIITFVDRTIQKMFGYKEEELIGKPVSLLVPPRYRKKHKKAIQNFMEKPREIKRMMETEGLKKNGETFPIEISLSSYKIGGNLNFIGVIRDITERKKLEEALREREERLKNFFESAEVGIWCFKPDKPVDINLPEEKLIEEAFNSRCVEANEKYAEMMGARREDLIGMRLSDVMPDTEENREYLRAFIRNGFRLSGGVSHEKNKKGEEKYFSNSMVATIKDGKVIEVWGTQIDITELKKLENQLKEALDRYSLIFRENPDGIFIFDENGKLIDVNKTVCQKLGYKKEELIGRNIKDFVRKKYYRQFKERMESLKKGKALSRPSIYEILNRRGKKIVVEVRTTPIEKDGKIVAFQGIARDITSEIEMKTFLEKLANTTPAGILIYQDDYFVYANRAAEEITGYSREELLNMHYWDFVHEDYREEIIERGKKRQEGRRVKQHVYEMPFYTKGGEIKWAIFCSASIQFRGRPAGLVTFIDISRLKEAQERLRESEEKYRLLAETAMDAIVIVQEDRILYANKQAEVLSGYKLNEIIGEDFTKFVEKEEADKLRKLYMEAFKNGIHGLRGETFIIKKNGEKRYVDISFSITTYHGKPAGIAILHDVTERKKMEEALRESEAHFRSLVENAYDAIYIITPEGFEYVNPAFERLTGYKAEEIYNPGFSFWDLIHKDDIPFIIEREKARKAGRPLPPSYSFRIVRKDGKIRWVEVTTVNIGKEGEVRVIGILRDVTERKKAEEEINKLSRLHYVIGKSINESDNIRQLCQRLLKNIKEIIGIDYANIFIYNREKNLLEPIAFYGYPKDFRKRVMMGYTLDKNQPWEAVQAAIHKKSRYIKDVKKHKPLSFNWDIYKKYDVADLYTVPLITKNELYGVLQVLNTSKNRLKGGDKKLLKSIADEIAAGIAKIKAHEEMMRALEEEKKFKADTAHYFFNPIAIAKGYLEMAKEDGVDKEKIEKALRAIERIERVVKNIVTRGEIRE